MKTIILLTFLVCVITDTSALNVTCEDGYKSFGNGLSKVYYCHTLMRAPQREMQEVTSVQGLSVENKTIKDVEAFLVYRQNVRIVPDGINKFFPNLKVLVIENSELDSFNQVNKLKKLKYLNLQYNKIEALYNDSFYGLQKLEKIFMSGNKIRKIETETFSNLMNLKLLSLNDNMLHKINENLFRSNPMLASLRFSNNQLNKINVEIFRPLKKLIELNFSGNRCIDDSYPLTISILSEFLNLIDKNC